MTKTDLPLKVQKQRQRHLKKEIREIEERILSLTIYNGNHLDVLRRELKDIGNRIERIEKEEK